ncbi:hypothetical protein M422DRAFT_259451 [Sphaerobolus stellatus SS14]|uniref:Uncharacterized protein n=1 Tax=Sphaerobolus stellatus (strain SS14) TaxID=990650 RepID=A0A0C9VKN0_SPHS4|nr:hypothetical protein M422DRAFT_259451 [Sphaerobolus stellatus SS14]
MSVNDVVRVDIDLKACLPSRYANMLQAMGSAQAIELNAVPQVLTLSSPLSPDVPPTPTSNSPFANKSTRSQPP